MRWIALIALGLLASPVAAQDPGAKIVPEFVGVWDKAPELTCSRAIGITPDMYGLALATLYSLSYGKDGNDRSAEIKPAVASSANMGTLMTELLRISKEQASDFACAEVPIATFNQPSTDKIERMIAQNILFTWHKQIELNGRLNAMTKQIETMSQADMADKMSTLQVDRTNQWNSLGPILEFILLKLVDGNRVSATNTLPYLIINKAQKADLLAKVHEYFPDVATKAPKDMDPATFDASLYLDLLTHRLASDEI